MRRFREPPRTGSEPVADRFRRFRSKERRARGTKIETSSAISLGADF
jgi:hypothetical protein